MDTSKKSPRIKSLFPIIVALTIILRLIFLTNIPYRVDGDSSKFGLDGISYFLQKPPFFTTGWMGHTNAYFYLVGFFTKIFSYPLFGIRLLSALGGVAGVLATYLFAKKLLGEKIGLWSALILTILPFDLVFSRNGTEVIWMTFFTPIVCYFLIREERSSYMLAGLFTGLAQYFYPAARLIPFLGIVMLLLQFKKLRVKKLIIAFLLWLVTSIFIFSPMINYYLKNPGFYNSRVRIISIFDSGKVREQQKKHTLTSYMIKQIKNNFFISVLPTNSTFLWYYQNPYLNFPNNVFFLLGILVSLAILSQWQYVFLLVYFVSGIIIGGVMTIDSPMPSRYIVLLPVVAIFTAIGVERSIKVLKKLTKNFASYTGYFLIILLFITDIHSYIDHEFVQTWKYDTNTQIATFAGRYLQSVPKPKEIYVLGDNNFYYESVPTLHFLTGIEGHNILDDVINHHFPRNNKKKFFIILNGRQPELYTLQKIFPTGSYKEFRNPLGVILFYLYFV